MCLSISKSIVVTVVAELSYKLQLRHSIFKYDTSYC